jgi:hypothetical protein
LHKGLDLAFDIDLLVRGILGGLENRARLAGQKSKTIFSLFEKVLPLVIVDELSRIAIRFES